MNVGISRVYHKLYSARKDRTRPMRGLKTFNSTKSILEGFTSHYNFVRPHQTLNGKTPAQATRMNASSNWKNLIEEATKHEAEILARTTGKAQETNTIEVMAIRDIKKF